MLRIRSTSAFSGALLSPSKDGEKCVDSTVINEAIKVFLTEIHSRLSEATRIAKAAEACASAGSVAEGVRVSMDIEQLIYEAGRLQGTRLHY